MQFKSNQDEASDSLQMRAQSEQSHLRALRVAIVGTGYIANFHAHAIRDLKGAELVSVCDVNLKAARSFADKWNIPSAFDSLDSMLRSERSDSVHVLVPPDAHYSVAKTVLEAGAHVLIEKPMCVSIEQADQLLDLARRKSVRLGVSHNMLFATPYQRLREAVHSGILGPLDHVTINHFLELGQIRFGPFDAWMLRAPGNIVFEVAPHLFSAVLDLVGTPSEVLVTADRNVDLPGGRQVYRRWRIRTIIGRTGVDININFGPGLPQRTINVRGLFGSASLDFDANTCTVDRRTTLGLDLDRYKRSRVIARQIKVQARATFVDYAFSKFKLRRRGDPYQITFLDSIKSFYSSISFGKKILDRRLDGVLGQQVVELCIKTVQAAGFDPSPASRPHHRNPPAKRPSILIIGGSGFIGRELTTQLIAAGYYLRVMTHTSGVTLEEFDSEHLEIVRGDMRNEADLNSAMQGIEFVYHLATADAKTWQDRLRNEVEPVRLLGKACLAARIRRLIYTSTIDIYNAGATAGKITETTAADPYIHRRNYYARAKAAAETILMEMYRARQLPAVIFRPGIVIGKGGNPFHFGVGMWSSESVCEIWGDGANALPFVLVSDVASALVRGVQVEGIEGHSYNLVDVPLLTARDYVNEFRRRTGMPLTVHYRPIWRFYLADLAKWLVKLVVRHPDRIRIPSFRDWESRTQRALFDCTRARIELNWTPASDTQRLIDEGIGGSLLSWLAACQ
jgi:predicted dehydrogenase/nucleoside-diphosphate-sugar epimerase